MKKQLITMASLCVVGLIAGCGGGASSSTPSPSALSAVSGKVADGYLVNATVFLDKNGNYQLDQGEPYATTDASGAYTLNMDPADVGKYPIVAMAIKGVTSDSDTGLLTQSYILSMPKDSVSGTVNSNFISPMSTVLREMMETGKYASMAQAMDDLRAKLGLPAGTNMMADYLSGQGASTSMHTAAQNMASLMGGEMLQVMTSAGTTAGTTTVDVNRYRGMMGAIFSNMSSIKGPNAQAGMTTLMNTMTSTLGNIAPNQPFRNMSSSFRGMMGGTSTTGTGMMGGTATTGSGATGGSTTGTGMTGGTTAGSGGSMM